MKLTCLVRAHWLEQPWQYTGMQHQHWNPLLRMFQSREYSLLKHTNPSLSSQKPARKINKHFTFRDKVRKFHRVIIFSYHSTIPAININLVSKQNKWKCPWIGRVCLHHKIQREHKSEQKAYPANSNIGRSYIRVRQFVSVVKTH